jgi:flagellar protein FlaG
MTNAIKITETAEVRSDELALPDARHDVGQQAASEEPVAEDVPPSPAELRLVIDFDETANTFVYKSIDRVTGEVVSQLPREDVLRLTSHNSYRPGRLINSRY